MAQNYFDIFLEYSVSEKALLFSFLVLFIIRFIYLFLFTGRILFQKKSDGSSNVKSPLSLLLTVRNEAENLKQNLPGILTLEKSDFEIVVVDDFSQDSSYQILGLLKERYKRLSFSTLNQETRYSTKLAQNIAVKAAKNDWLVFIPVSLSACSDSWLESISEKTTENKDLVMAYSGIVGSKGFYNFLYRIESYFLFTKSTAYILNGIPFVYEEENVAFRKEKYFALGGYGLKITEPYANLELLLNSFIQKKRTSVLYDKVAVVQKQETVVKGDYLELLKKSFRIEKHLKPLKRNLLLLDEMGKMVLFPLLLVVFLVIPEFWILFAGMLGLKLSAHLFIIKMSQNRLNERKIFIPSLIYELIMPYFKLFFRWHFNRRSKKNRWKTKV